MKLINCIDSAVNNEKYIVVLPNNTFLHCDTTDLLYFYTKAEAIKKAKLFNGKARKAFLYFVKVSDEVNYCKVVAIEKKMKHIVICCIQGSVPKKDIYDFEGNKAF